MQDHLFIRDYLAEDFDAVTILWRIARERSMPDFQRVKGHFFYEDREYFQYHIMRKNRVWVAVANGGVSAFMAMDGDFIDQLYVHPDRQRRGVGKALLDFAREKSPEHLWLYTLQANAGARDFYEKNGFVAGKFGVSPPPENEPDIEYHWRS